jgi:hypothetical protein
VEAGVGEVGVGEVEAEVAAGGEGEGFGEVAVGQGVGAGVGVEGGAGEEAEGEVVLGAGAAEAVEGLGEVGGGRGEVGGGVALGGEEVGAAEGEVIEGDVEERVPGRDGVQHARGAFPHLGVPALIEQEVAVQEAPERVEPRISRLPLLLHPLGFLELRDGFLPAAQRVQGRSDFRPADHALGGVTALVGEVDAGPGLRHGLAQVAVGLEKLSASRPNSSLPVAGSRPMDTRGAGAGTVGRSVGVRGMARLGSPVMMPARSHRGQPPRPPPRRQDDEAVAAAVAGPGADAGAQHERGADRSSDATATAWRAALPSAVPSTFSSHREAPASAAQPRARRSPPVRQPPASAAPLD